MEKHLTVESLRIVDKDGNVRASLSTDESGRVSLLMTDDNGKVRAAVSVEKDGVPSVVLSSKDSAKIVLQVHPEGETPMITLSHTGIPSDDEIIILLVDGEPMIKGTNRAGVKLFEAR
jgi:hypothetical protein